MCDRDRGHPLGQQLTNPNRRGKQAPQRKARKGEGCFGLTHSLGGECVGQPSNKHDNVFSCPLP